MTDRPVHLSGMTIRAATPEDDDRIVPLLCRTLGWEDDERHRALFEWKHRLNPFGTSPGWLAEDDEGLVGSRTFMRWEFERGGERISAVRAVDTATDPRAQGRGVFRSLTMTGVETLAAAGVRWVFNTPNTKSAPGYLSMGWREVGRLGVSLRPAGVRALPRIVSARQPGDLWSVPTSIGDDAATVLEDAQSLSELLAACPRRTGITTGRNAEFLRWRYGRCPVGYRALLGGRTLSDGILLFRLRRRGPAVEAVVGDVLVAGHDRRKRISDLWHRLLRAGEADYGIALGPSAPRWWLPVPGNGPLLTWRALADREEAVPPLADWDLTAGDIELF